MKGARVGRCAGERLLAENEIENAKRMRALLIVESEETAFIALNAKNLCEVKFEEILGNGACALIAKPPSPAVGQDTPS
jgi:hypothetical protein